MLKVTSRGRKIIKDFREMTNDFGLDQTMHALNKHIFCSDLKTVKRILVKI